MVKTDTVDVQAAALELKNSIGRAVSVALAVFKTQTNVSPSAIKIQMVNVTAHGQSGQYVIGDVKVEFEL